MGRWGYRLFEGDIDIDLALEFSNAFKDKKEDEENEKNEIDLSAMIHQTDMLAPQEAREFYQTDAYAEKLNELVEENRKKLDAGLGDKLLDKFRAKENDPWFGELRVILLGAIMMRAGAKIRNDEMQHLRELANKFPGIEGFRLPISDNGLRGPGEAQFLAALDNYQPGTPRSFQEPSCFKCGKVKRDIGKAPLRCARCKDAWYCDNDCQKAHWTAHKSVCVPLGQRRMLNV
jgi:hypothetical protein